MAAALMRKNISVSNAYYDFLIFSLYNRLKTICFYILLKSFNVLILVFVFSGYGSHAHAILVCIFNFHFLIFVHFDTFIGF
jgi:hypothetical protein